MRAGMSVMGMSHRDIEQDHTGLVLPPCGFNDG